MIRKTKNWHQLSVPDALNNTRSQLHGLASDDVNARLEESGFNELTQEKKVSPVILLLNQFKSALILILLVAVGLSLFIGITNYFAKVHSKL